MMSLLDGHPLVVPLGTRATSFAQDGDYFNDVYKYEIATSMWGSVDLLALDCWLLVDAGWKKGLFSNLSNVGQDR